MSRAKCWIRFIVSKNAGEIADALISVGLRKENLINSVTVAWLFDHLVRPRQHVRWNREADVFAGFQPTSYNDRTNLRVIALLGRKEKHG